MSAPIPDNNAPVLQGRVVIQDGPINPSIGSRLVALGRAIAGYIGLHFLLLVVLTTPLDLLVAIF